MKAPGVRLIKQRHTLKSGAEVWYWRLRWPGKNGNWRTESIGRVGKMTEAEAGRMRRKKIADIENGKALRDRPGMSLGQFLDLDRAGQQSVVQPATLKTYDRAKLHAAGAIGADVPLDLVEWHHVDRLINWLSGEHRINGKMRPGCSRATVKQTIATLKAAFNRAADRGLITANPFSRKGPKKVQPAQKRIFTPAEVAAMIEAAPDLWWRAFLRLAFTTGLRLGELLNLTWDDIDVAGGQVIVSAKRAKSPESGDFLLAFSSKAHQERRVPLHTDAAEALQRLRLKAGASPYVFLTLDRLAVLARRKDVRARTQPPAFALVNNYLRDYKMIQAKARAMMATARDVELEAVAWNVGSIHDIRKTYGTRMAQHVKIHELQRLMGHSSITTTADFYLDVTEDVAAKVQAAFAG